MSSRFNIAHVSQGFGRAASQYDEHATLQQHVSKEATHLLLPYASNDSRVLDAGCGTALASDILRGHFPGIAYLGLDISAAMCTQAKARGAKSLCANADAIPVADSSMDCVLSSLMLQWANFRVQVFQEFFRVSKPGAVAIITVFGEQTLRELTAAFAVAGSSHSVSEFPSMKVLRGEVGRAGWKCDHYFTRTYSQHYSTLNELMKSIKTIGASNKLQQRKKGLTTASFYKSAEQYYQANYAHADLIRATWQVHFMVLKK